MKKYFLFLLLGIFILRLTNASEIAHKYLIVKGIEKTGYKDSLFLEKEDHVSILVEEISFQKNIIYLLKTNSPESIIVIGEGYIKKDEIINDLKVKLQKKHIIIEECSSKVYRPYMTDQQSL